MDESERIFSRLIRSIEKQGLEVKELIRGRERAAVSQAAELLEKLQREIVELRRNEAELEKLCRSDDHVHFLQVGNQSRGFSKCFYFLKLQELLHLCQGGNVFTLLVFKQVYCKTWSDILDIDNTVKM